MRGFEAILLDIIIPALIVLLLVSAVAYGAWAPSARRSKFSQSLGTGPLRHVKGALFIVVMVLFAGGFLATTMSKAMFLYHLNHLASRDVAEIDVGSHRFKDEASIAPIVSALNRCEWYSVSHGGWGDETPIILKTSTGDYWWMRAGYHFAQHGTVLIRSSAPNGAGLNQGELFCTSLSDTLSALQAPLSVCDTAHGYPCPTPPTAH